MEMTAFEEEVLESILWQLEGFRLGKVTERVTKRILRTTLRRIKPRLVARSIKAIPGILVEVDHAVPVNIVVQKMLECNVSTKDELRAIICRYLVAVELAKEEHRDVLKIAKLQSVMPHDWDGVCPFARYKAAGIEVVAC